MTLVINSHYYSIIIETSNYNNRGRLLNVSFDKGVEQMDWRGACIVPL